MSRRPPAERACTLAAGLASVWLGGSVAFASGTLGKGDRWEEWNKTMRDTLVKDQIDAPGDARIDGSWKPVSRGGQYGGRVYSTAMACLSLEVYYRYKRVD